MANILLVDPSIASRLVVLKDLEERGHNVEESTSGREAVEICEKHAPDVLVLELVLHEMDGFKVIRSLKEMGSTIPIIVTTDVRMKSVRKMCEDLEVAAFFRKPVAVTTFLEKLEEILRSLKDENAPLKTPAEPPNDIDRGMRLR